MPGVATVYWVCPLGKGRLAIILRPKGHPALEDDLKALKAEGIDVVVSLLEESEARSLGLAEEGRLAVAAGMEFYRLPCTDMGVLHLPTAKPDIDALRRALADGKSLGLHCRMSMGRAPTLAATLMKLHGIAPDQAWEMISTARGLAVPDTQGQVDWVEALEPW
jgi:protein-tyrosine phosphatase